jgi:hypothetical protein
MKLEEVNKAVYVLKDREGTWVSVQSANKTNYSFISDVKLSSQTNAIKSYWAIKSIKAKWIYGLQPRKTSLYFLFFQPLLLDKTFNSTKRFHDIIGPRTSDSHVSFCT